MKKLRALSIIACSVVCSISASAATLTLNMSGGGTQTFEFSGVLTLNNGDVTVDNVSGGSGSSDGNSSSSVQSSSSSSSSSSVLSSSSVSSSSNSSVGGSCSVPNGVQVVAAPFYWYQFTGSMMFDLLGNGTVASFPVTTGSRNGASGGMNAGPQSWTSHVTREFWISECPGGEPISAYCHRRSSGAMSISWIQGSQRGRCELETNTRYYVNLRNIYDPANPQFSCIINKSTPNCNAYIQHRPSGSVD
jgi:hypothetical protein